MRLLIVGSSEHRSLFRRRSVRKIVRAPFISSSSFLYTSSKHRPRFVGGPSVGSPECPSYVRRFAPVTFVRSSEQRSQARRGGASVRSSECRPKVFHSVVRKSVRAPFVSAWESLSGSLPLRHSLVLRSVLRLVGGPSVRSSQCPLYASLRAVRKFVGAPFVKFAEVLLVNLQELRLYVGFVSSTDHSS